MDIGAWMDGFEVAAAPARAVRDAESVVLMARHEQLRARVDSPGLSYDERVAVGRELQGLVDASYVLCKADLAVLAERNRASRAWLEGLRDPDGTGDAAAC